MGEPPLRPKRLATVGFRLAGGKPHPLAATPQHLGMPEKMPEGVPEKIVRKIGADMPEVMHKKTCQKTCRTK